MTAASSVVASLSILAGCFVWQDSLFGVRNGNVIPKHPFDGDASVQHDTTGMSSTADVASSDSAAGKPVDAAGSAAASVWRLELLLVALMILCVAQALVIVRLLRCRNSNENASSAPTE